MGYYWILLDFLGFSWDLYEILMGFIVRLQLDYNIDKNCGIRMGL